MTNLVWIQCYDQPIFRRLRTAVLIHVLFLVSKIKLAEPIKVICERTMSPNPESGTTCPTEPPVQSEERSAKMFQLGCDPRSLEAGSEN